jgi:hypothetical protein
LRERIAVTASSRARRASAAAMAMPALYPVVSAWAGAVRGRKRVTAAAAPETIARPTAPPICCEALCSAEVIPARRGCRPVVPAAYTGAKLMP